MAARGVWGESLLASKLLGLRKKKNVLVEEMTRVARRSWRTLAVFMRAALESYFMIKGPRAKISSLRVASSEKNNNKKNTENKAASNDPVCNTFSPSRGAING